MPDLGYLCSRKLSKIIDLPKKKSKNQNKHVCTEYYKKKIQSNIRKKC